MEGGEWKVEVEVGCPPWASVVILFEGLRTRVIKGTSTSQT